MLEEKKVVAAELRNIERLMGDVEKRLTYFLTEFAVDDANPEPPMGKFSYTALAQCLMGIHEATVDTRQIMIRAQNMIHTHWGE